MDATTIKLLCLTLLSVENYAVIHMLFYPVLLTISEVRVSPRRRYVLSRCELYTRPVVLF
jgi:hypothetical protein